jgi:hypothetical protein
LFCDCFRNIAFRLLTALLQLWISSKARLGFVSRVLRRAIVGGNRSECYQIALHDFV